MVLVLQGCEKERREQQGQGSRTVGQQDSREDHIPRLRQSFVFLCILLSLLFCVLLCTEYPERSGCCGRGLFRGAAVGMETDVDIAGINRGIE